MTLFSGTGRLRVAVLFSGGASGFRYLRKYDPNYGEGYEVVVGFTDSPGCDGVEVFQAEGIPVETNDIKQFYAGRDADRRDLDVRAEFDARTRDILGEYSPDIVLLSGYMWIVTKPLIERFPLLNVHPADLTITDDGGSRRYVGADPVYDAITAGEPETRSSVHFVTEDVDEGPLLVLSKPFPVYSELVESLQAFDADSALREYVAAHQEWMKWEGDGPALKHAVALIASGRVNQRDGELTVDGESGHVTLNNE